MSKQKKAIAAIWNENDQTRTILWLDDKQNPSQTQEPFDPQMLAIAKAKLDQELITVSQGVHRLPIQHVHVTPNADRLGILGIVQGPDKGSIRFKVTKIAPEDISEMSHLFAKEHGCNVYAFDIEDDSANIEMC
ncbi:hypothetical protein [Mucisphaera sp.]|uniref:hypothetical protein n=1 Tax=Mucisphaera sp. TaxID=2913024 RepID=UPI003D146CB9